MFTILRHTLIRLWSQILGWGLSLAALGLYIIQLYDTVARQGDMLAQLVRGYPPELMAFFGDATSLTTPSGYLTFTFFSYMPPLLGVLGAVLGCGLLAGDEENGTLDLVLAHPISRTGLFFGRLAGLLLALLAILALTWIGLVATLGRTGLAVRAGEMALPLVSLLAVTLFFGMLGLLLSQWLPSVRLAASVAALAVVANYFLTSLGSLDVDLKRWAELTPLYYYQGGDAVLGLKWAWIAGLLAGAILFALGAWWQFLRRDIRVAGEGSWALPAFLRPRTR